DFHGSLLPSLVLCWLRAESMTHTARLRHCRITLLESARFDYAPLRPLAAGAGSTRHTKAAVASAGSTAKWLSGGSASRIRRVSICSVGEMAADGHVRLRDVTVRYGRRVALEAVSGDFASGSLTAVVGANGAGKTTLLAAIAGVVRPSGGTVECPARQR